MQQYPFIFSDKQPHRLRRHLVFWGCWWLFQSFLYSFSGGIFKIDFFQHLPLTALESLIFLAPHLFLAYSLLYFVIPRMLLKGKYLATVTTVMLLFLATGAIASVLGVYVVGPLRQFFYPDGQLKHINEVNLFLGLLAGLRGAITIGGIAAAIKLMKYLYLKEQRNLQLQKENVSSQLQLLKAQVHPHFLFNTLNNIYAAVQAGTPGASQMVLGLSDLLRYMLYECDRPLVPLDKELKMLRQYMLLEEARYGERLDLAINLPPRHADELQIAPLLLLPFVENCFKHGTSNMLEQPWISLDISLEANQMKMKLVNGKAAGEGRSTTGIGLENAGKRLELLYPGKHSLSINNEEEVFVVNLKLELETSENVLMNPSPIKPWPAYA